MLDDSLFQPKYISNIANAHQVLIAGESLNFELDFNGYLLMKRLENAFLNQNEK